MIRLGIAAVLAFSACDGGRSGQKLGVSERRDPNIVLVGRASDAVALDPAKVGDTESVEISEQLFETLIRFNPQTQTYEGALAERWDVAENGTEWTFHLRRGVRFHDGSALNADAVVFSLERQRDHKHPYHFGGTGSYAYWNSNYRYVETIEAVDEHTVKITIERPYAPFVANMAMFPVAIVSPTAVAVSRERFGMPESGSGPIGAPVGTGPFRFVSWQNGRIVLERNPDYWGTPPAIERLVFQAIPDARQRLVALESGAIDVAYSILPEELQFVSLHPELVLHRASANNVVYLAMNTQKAPFGDIRVRHAVNHAINKEPIVKLAYQGLARVAHGPLSEEQWAYHKAQDQYLFDITRARELLQEAAADGTIDLDKTYALYAPATPRPYLPDPVSVARVLAANLDAIGLKTRLVVQPFERHLFDLRRGAHDLCLHGWVADNGDPDNFLYVLFDSRNSVSGAARNVAFFRDPELDGLFTLAQESEDRAEREGLYRRAQGLIARAAPWAPLAHSEVAIAARRDLEGIEPTPATTIRYEGVRRTRR